MGQGVEQRGQKTVTGMAGQHTPGSNCVISPFLFQ